MNNTNVLDSWTAVAFSKDNQMGDDSVVLCRQSTLAQNGNIETYYNFGNVAGIVNASRPRIGLFDGLINVSNRFLVCQFSRQNSLPEIQNKFFDINSPNVYNILIASGATNHLGKL